METDTKDRPFPDVKRKEKERVSGEEISSPALQRKKGKNV